MQRHYKLLYIEADTTFGIWLQAQLSPHKTLPPIHHAETEFEKEKERQHPRLQRQKVRLKGKKPEIERHRKLARN